MINTELFNTHNFIKSLVKAGMDEKQAEILAEHYLTMFETQEQLNDVRKELTSKIDDSKVDGRFYILLAALLVNFGVVVSLAFWLSRMLPS